MPWKPPKTVKGHPCQRCQKGRLCPSHRVKRRKPAKSSGKRGPYKLKRSLLDALPALVARCRSYTEIWEGLGIAHPTFYAWLDEGEKHADEGVASLEREFYEVVVMQRRLLAQRLVGSAVRAAEGVWREEVTKGEGGEEVLRVYQEPPNGVLAMRIAGRIDPVAMPPEKQRLEHGGVVGVAGVFRERLADVFADDEDEEETSDA